MNCLVIDTPTPKGQLFLIKENFIFQKIFLSPSSSKDLPSLIISLYQQSPFPIETIAYCQGPGAFSSLRQGAIIASILSKLYSLNLVSYSSLLAKVPRNHLGPFEVLLDARGGRSFFASGIQSTTDCSLSYQKLVDIPSEEPSPSDPEQILFLLQQATPLDPNLLLIDYLKPL